jgi:hypothetical protein
VAELVDAADSKSVALTGVLVRVRPGAPIDCSATLADGRQIRRNLAFFAHRWPPVFADVPVQPRKSGAFFGGLFEREDARRMALTDTAIKAAKPRERAYKLADAGGL